MEKEAILKYLISHNLMTVATSDGDQPWCFTTFYGADENLNIYFLSNPQTRHAQAIAKNPKVAATIVDSQQSILGKKSGIQIEGIMEIINQGTDEHEVALELWLKALGGFQNKDILEQTSVHAMTGTLYRLKPEYIRYLNEELFGTYGFKELRLG